MLLDTKVGLGSPVYIFSLFICQTVALVTENSYHIIIFFKEVFFFLKSYGSRIIHIISLFFGIYSSYQKII